VQTRFGERITTIAVNRKEDAQIVRDYRAAFPLPQNITYTQDAGDAYYARSGGQSMPEVILYDSEGNLVVHLLELPTVEELSTLISPLLED
jgi:hypothetical protein